MSKYQEALDNIVKESCPIAMKSKKSCNECEIKNTCNCKAKDWINTLQELINQAKKEHELLELYREYHIVRENSEFYKRLYTSLLESNRDYHDDYLSYKRCEEDKDKIIERIMKLEEELKVKE